MVGSEIKQYNGRKLPSKLEFYPLEEKGQKTIIYYNKWNFDIKVPENYFSTQFVSRLK